MQESYVVTLTLSTEKFQETLKNGSPVTQAAVEEFHVKWKKTREAMSDDDPANVRLNAPASMKQDEGAREDGVMKG